MASRSESYIASPAHLSPSRSTQKNLHSGLGLRLGLGLGLGSRSKPKNLISLFDSSRMAKTVEAGEAWRRGRAKAGQMVLGAPVR